MNARSSVCSTVLIISFMNAWRSPKESAMFAALYTWASGE